MPDERDRFVANGPAEAIDRLLTTWLLPDDSVAIGDPAWLSTVEALRRRGLRSIAVSTDTEGLLPASLQQALQAGARAVIGTSRMRHSQCYGVSPARALALAAVLEAHPDVAVIEDERFVGTVPAPLRAASTRRWAAIRSAEALLGAELGLSLVSTDASTAEGLDEPLGETLHVAHLLQRRIASHEVDDPARRARRLVTELGRVGVQVPLATLGLNCWARIEEPPAMRRAMSN